MDIDPDRLNAFMGKMLGDMGAAANAALIKVGDRLGLYKMLAAQGPMTPAELARASGTAERCIREWLSAQAAAGYIEYDAASGKFHMQRTAAREDGLGDRVSFAVATAKTFPSNDYDLVCFFDCLHDMGDPVGALRHVASTMAEDGTCMLVEPFANDKLEQNLNPVGSLFYAASTMICTPASMAQEVGLALGAQAGEARLREVAKQGGLTRFRRATETPFNLILEARV